MALSVGYTLSQGLQHEDVAGLSVSNFRVWPCQSCKPQMRSGPLSGSTRPWVLWGVAVSHRMSILITGDALANHVPAGWPDESLAGSDSEELDTEPHLKVETKVSVELHRQAQGNHCGDRPPDLESGVLAKPVAVLSSQPQEQRKGTSGEPCCLSLEQTLSQNVGQGQKSLFSRLRGILWRVWVEPGQAGKNRPGSVTCSKPSVPS